VPETPSAQNKRPCATTENSEDNNVVRVRLFTRKLLWAKDLGVGGLLVC